MARHYLAASESYRYGGRSFVSEVLEESDASSYERYVLDLQLLSHAQVTNRNWAFVTAEIRC